MPQLVLLRHGESLWNKENRFTGWTDVPLSDQGIIEAQRAGQTLLEAGFQFDRAFSSILKRAIHTLWLSLAELDRLWIPIERSWRLNERHYGALQGLNKSELTSQYGAEQILQWRRSYDVPPPALDAQDSRHPRFDPRYQYLAESALPATECLHDTIMRVVPYWEDVIAPCLHRGEKILIVAHGNSLRALINYLDQLSKNELLALNIPTGIPLVYDLDKHLRPLQHAYLGDPELIAKASASVANQANKK